MCKFFFSDASRFLTISFHGIVSDAVIGRLNGCRLNQKPRISPIPLVIQTAPIVVMVYMTPWNDCSEWKRQ